MRIKAKYDKEGLEVIEDESQIGQAGDRGHQELEKRKMMER